MVSVLLRARLRKTVYGQVFLPWLQAVPVHTDSVCVSCKQIWSAKNIFGGGNEVLRKWGGKPIDVSHLRFKVRTLRRRPCGAARRTCALAIGSGRADWCCCRPWMGNILAANGASAAKHFPAIFPRWEDALHRASELAPIFDSRAAFHACTQLQRRFPVTDTLGAQYLATAEWLLLLECAAPSPNIDHLPVCCKNSVNLACLAGGAEDHT